MGMRVIVTGYLGAGKTLLIRHLGAVTDWDLVEGDPLVVPDGGDAVIAVADAANLAGLLADPLVGELVRGQIGAAGSVVLTRSDLVDAAPALAALEALTRAPVVVAPFGEADPGALVLAVGTPGGPDLRAAFARWEYEGGAPLSLSAAEKLIARRPRGIYRLTGEVLLHEGGLSVEVTGRQRETRPIGAPAETRLVAIGPKDRFQSREMDAAFADAVAASLQTGIFGYR